MITDMSLQKVAVLGFALPQSLRQELYIVVPLVVVTLGIFVWAYFFRKKPRQRKYRHHHQKHADKEAVPQGEAAPAPEPVTRRRHRARRSKYPPRPLNPTLAQSRGLPPMRDESTPPAGL
jgi:hypothetical protein